VNVKSEPSGNSIVDSSDIEQKHFKLQEQYIEKISGYLKYNYVVDELTIIVTKCVKKPVFDYYEYKVEADKYIKKVTTEYYNKAFNFTLEASENSTTAAINAYKAWLKEQIFDRQLLDFKYETTWLTLKNKYRKSFDAETEYADRLEQMYEDGEGND
jgi:hypothetical protein